MKFWPLWIAAARSTGYRAALTTASVAVAFVLYGYLGAIGRAFDVGVSVAGADRIIVRHRASIILALPETHGARIKSIGGVAVVTHATWFGGIYRDSRNYFPQFAVEPDGYREAYPDLLLSDEEVATWEARPDAAVVGPTTAERFGWSVGDRISLNAPLWPRDDGSTNWEFLLVGIYAGADENVDLTPFLLRYDYFDATRHEAQAGRVGWYIVRVENTDEAPRVARDIDRVFANSLFETRSEAEFAFVQSFVDQIGEIGTVLRVILAAVFGTILLVATNTMAANARSRLDQFALLRALGFRRSFVLGFIVGESCVIATIAGLLGLGVSHFLISAGDPTGGALPAFHFPAALWGRGAALALGLGFFAGLPAAWAVFRHPAAALLRGAA